MGRRECHEGKGGKNTEKHFLHWNRVSCGLPNDHWRLLLHVRFIKFGFAALTANAACQGGSHNAQHTGHPPKCNSISKDEAKNVATIQHDLVKNEFIGVPPWPMSLLLKQPYCQEAVLTRTLVQVRCYHLYDSDMLRLHSQSFIHVIHSLFSLPKRKSSRDLRMSSDLKSCQTRSLLLDISALVVITEKESQMASTNGPHEPIDPKKGMARLTKPRTMPTPAISWTSGSSQICSNSKQVS